MSKGQRFEKIYTQGAMTTTEIWVDKETGGQLSVSCLWDRGRHDSAFGQRRKAYRFADYERLIIVKNKGAF